MAKSKQVDIEELTRPGSACRFRSAHDGRGDVVSRESAHVFVGASSARQEFKEDADINTIVKRFGLTGELPSVVRVPTYGDFSEVGDFRSAVHMVMEAEAAFMALPAQLRARFDNDPQSLMEFVAERANLDEARSLGLVEPDKTAPAPLSTPSPSPSTGAPASPEAKS